MEFLIGLVFEVLGEIGIQLVFQSIVEAVAYGLRDKNELVKPPSPWVLAFGCVLLGAMVGGVSLLIFSASWIHSPLARGVNLVLAPVAGGLAMAAMGAWRAKRGQMAIPLDRFTYGFAFAFGITAVRFVGAG